MKYIRTKDDRIVAIPNNSKFILYDDEKLVINTTKKGYTCIYGIVKKKADTIEELIDVYVYYLKSGGAFIDGELANKFDIYESVYGAIWTDKCLLYVAKVNKKGKLELL